MKRLPLILASQSPRRKVLLEQIGLSFSVRPSSVREDLWDHETPDHNVRRIALSKAREIAATTRRGIVIGADTVVVIDGTILGKPKSKSEAVRMLKRLSGRMHTVYTGFALVDAASNRHVVRTEKTRVWFRDLNGAEIRRYVASGSPMDKAGSYGIQDDYGAVFVRRVAGCFYNVVGFPLTRFYQTLEEFTGYQYSGIRRRIRR
jgi:septum formation protein